ncbi:MAG: Smr/MutS family protein [Treponemataceae bacterium]|nr:Smr/MutS family protein [Treponemataceae bacterium]
MGSNKDFAMDFGDILNAWEESEKKAKKNTQKSNGSEWRNKKTEPDSVSASGSGKKAGTEKSKEIHSEGAAKAKPAVDPMTLWLRRYGVVDKDAEEEKIAAREQQQDRNYLRAMPYEATIDLHGLTQDEAYQLLSRFITDCSRMGLQKVLIIHGKGNHSESEPVLSRMVRSFIERDYRLGESGHPDKSEGGKGATWVIIRKKGL